MYEKYDEQAKIIRYIDYFEYRKYELENDYKKEMAITNYFGKFDNVAQCDWRIAYWKEYLQKHF